MPSEEIKINDIEFIHSIGKPFIFKGILSESNLSGIDLDFVVSGDDKIELIKDLFKCETVEVYDPFTERSYTAIIHLSSSSYQTGIPECHYMGQVKELDRVPDFSSLEINGVEFELFRYKGGVIEGDKIGHHALLKLNKEKFKTINKIIKEDSVKVRRIGIDEEPILLRFGSRMYWSNHEENGKVYFKYIVRLFPLDLKIAKLNIASGNIQIAVARMMISLNLKFEILLEDLFRSNNISEDLKTQLSSESFRELVTEDRFDDLFTQLCKVQDAEMDFD